MTSQYDAYALHAGLAKLHARMRMHAPTRPCTHMHVRTHKSISNTYCLFHGNSDSRTRLSVTLYVHCPSSLL
jgi:hypothetical protein